LRKTGQKLIAGQMTEEPYIHRQLMRMHGFSLMSMVLTGLVAERSIVLLVSAG